MTVKIVEVMNNTSGVLHYYNQELGTKFDVQPTTKTYGDGGYISTSPYNPDTVPWKSSGRKIIITVDNGPQYAVCDDSWKFSVISNGHEEKWTSDFTNWAEYVMRVDNDGIAFVKYEPGLRANPNGFVWLKGMPAFSEVFGNAAPIVAF